MTAPSHLPHATLDLRSRMAEGAKIERLLEFARGHSVLHLLEICRRSFLV